MAVVTEADKAVIKETPLEVISGVAIKDMPVEPIVFDYMVKCTPFAWKSLVQHTQVHAQSLIKRLVQHACTYAQVTGTTAPHAASVLGTLAIQEETPDEGHVVVQDKVIREIVKQVPLDVIQADLLVDPWHVSPGADVPAPAPDVFAGPLFEHYRDATKEDARDIHAEPGPFEADICTHSSVQRQGPGRPVSCTLAEKIYPTIAKWYPQLAGKITDTLLEKDNSELLILLDSPPQMKQQADEAFKVLQQSSLSDKYMLLRETTRYAIASRSRSSSPPRTVWRWRSLVFQRLHRRL